ncbi:hypothetical protein L1047_11010 [Synechococcus sp. Nb3U1]|uniref:hypothetical protein n=1 Tax=Synechococcus sp. Nb3U1 TaxID=1914529 RepID=UPI001F1DB491|nr:hypothetical protein [Synechococcus sp. Nb3U1]MCF2971723.1 hypothetical protein [Synechococcus sp. Nb3U1]
MPLPLVGLSFWVGGQWITEQALSQPRPLDQPLTITSQQQATLVLDILAIEAEIRTNRGYTKVDVTTSSPVLRKLEYEFAELDPNEVTLNLARQLGLTTQQVERLTRYRFSD